MEFDLIIVGSGLVGASLALALKSAGLKIALVEARPPVAFDTTDWDSRIYAISPGSAAFLESCGAWSAMDLDRVCRVEEMSIFGDDDHSRLGFSAYESGLRELAFIVENRELQQALWRAVHREPAIELFAPATCRELTLTEDEACLKLSDGGTLRAKLVVGADGADSWVRAQADVDVEVRAYGQTAVVANFTVEKPHRGTACQWFKRGGVLALLPLPGNRVSMVWSIAEEGAARLLEASAAELATQVAAASHDRFGNLDLITPAMAFPLRLQRVRSLAAHRLTLVGDAAHSVHPLAGQGVNLGLRDARELAQVMLQRGPQQDCGDFFLLRRYARARREDIVATQFATDSLHRMFANDSPAIGKLRNLGLQLTNRQTRLKNLLVQHAVG
jgi:2-polyprenylphenol 6-hydroxylase